MVKKFMRLNFVTNEVLRKFFNTEFFPIYGSTYYSKTSHLLGIFACYSYDLFPCLSKPKSALSFMLLQVMDIYLILCIKCNVKN